MRFKLDENLPAEIGGPLRALGHLVDTVGDEGLAGSPDETVVAAARRDQRILFTLDKGIANLVRFPAQSHGGIVMFRPASQERGAVAVFVMNHLDALLQLPLARKVTVVSATRIRIR